MELNRLQGFVDSTTPIEKTSRAPSDKTERSDPNPTSEAPFRGESPEAEQAPAPRDAVASILVQQEFPPRTRLHLDEGSNRIVAQVLDENNEVVRQTPPQELLDISARFNRLEGLLFDEQR